ncbi:MAG: Tfp pilus assembly protein FimT/FimU [bacterium]
MRTQNGFTLLELIIVVSIISIGSALALPNMKAIFSRIKFNSQVSILQNDFQMIRFKAINGNCPYKIVFTLSTTAQDTYKAMYFIDESVWKTDRDISNRTIKKEVDIAYIDNTGNVNGNFEKIFYPDGSCSDGATISDGVIFLKFADKIVNKLGYDLKKKISITQATGFVRVVEGW